MLLAIDTSTRYAGVSLCDEDRALSTLCWHSTQNHTTELMASIKYILDRSNLRPSQLDCIAVALGPGGFSSLRVGLSVAKGLVLPNVLPLVGVGTLEMEAFPYANTGLPICAIMNVGRGEVAAATFKGTNSSWQKLEEGHICSPEDLVSSIVEPTIVCGEGVEQHADYLLEALGGLGVVLTPHSATSRISALGRLGQQRFQNGQVDNLATLQPDYIRRPSIGAPKTPNGLVHSPSNTP